MKLYKKLATLCLLASSSLCVAMDGKEDKQDKESTKHQRTEASENEELSMRRREQATGTIKEAPQTGNLKNKPTRRGRGRGRGKVLTPASSARSNTQTSNTTKTQSTHLINNQETGKLDIKAASNTVQADSHSLYNLGISYYQQGNYKEAIKHLKPLADQGYPSPQYYLGLTYYKQNNLEEAIRYFKPLSDKNANALYYLGLIYYKQNNLEETIKYYKLAADQGHHGSQHSLGFVYQQQGNLEEAMKHLKPFADQGDANAQCNVGIIYYQQGKFEEAIKYYQLAIDQGDTKAQHNLDIIKKEKEMNHDSFPSQSQKEGKEVSETTTTTTTTMPPSIPQPRRIPAIEEIDPAVGKLAGEFFYYYDKATNFTLAIAVNSENAKECFDKSYLEKFSKPFDGNYQILKDGKTLRPATAEDLGMTKPESTKRAPKTLTRKKLEAKTKESESKTLLKRRHSAANLQDSSQAHEKDNGGNSHKQNSRRGLTRHESLIDVRPMDKGEKPEEKEPVKNEERKQHSSKLKDAWKFLTTTSKKHLTSQSTTNGTDPGTQETPEESKSLRKRSSSRSLMSSAKEKSKEKSSRPASRSLASSLSESQDTSEKPKGKSKRHPRSLSRKTSDRDLMATSEESSVEGDFPENSLISCSMLPAHADDYTPEHENLLLCLLKRKYSLDPTDENTLKIILTGGERSFEIKSGDIEALCSHLNKGAGSGRSHRKISKMAITIMPNMDGEKKGSYSAQLKQARHQIIRGFAKPLTWEDYESLQQAETKQVNPIQTSATQESKQ